MKGCQAKHTTSYDKQALQIHRCRNKIYVSSNKIKSSTKESGTENPFLSFHELSFLFILWEKYKKRTWISRYLNYIGMFIEGHGMA